MTDGFLDGDVFRGLAFRILLLLSLALLPFGIIAAMQTQELARQADRSAELSLLGLTEQAATAERAAIQEAFGAASALGSVISHYLDTPQECSAFLADYRARTPQYVHVGYVPPDGVMRCSSSGRSYDVTEMAEYNAEMMQWPARNVMATPAGPLSGQPVLVINHPFEQDGQFAGYITISLPLAVIRGIKTPMLERQPFDLVTFNNEGKVLLTDRGASTDTDELPQNRSLAALTSEQPLVFRDENALGDTRVYAVVPIVSGVVYSMSLWRETDVVAAVDQSGQLRFFLPVLMWVASLVVAFWSLNRLAVRHIRKLVRQMRLFAFNRSMPRSTLGPEVPRELVELQKAFLGMADSIIRDETALENSLRDKNILLKEVHHRVKNNLQLISSIMNMQIRRAQTEDARFVLRRLQDRLLSLATVHKNLYQSDELDRVEAGALLDEIVGQLLVVGLSAGSGVTVDKHFDRIEMDADDAAPLTLLVSEAVTNAMKYIGAPPGCSPRLEVSLGKIAPDRACFRIANSTGPKGGSEGTGLGSQLINAFAGQLNAEVAVSYEDGIHALELSFPVIFRDKFRADF